MIEEGRKGNVQNSDNDIKEFEKTIRQFSRDSADIVAEVKKRMHFSKERGSKKRVVFSTILAEIRVFMRERGILLIRKSRKDTSALPKFRRNIRLESPEPTRNHSYEIPLTDEELSLLKGTPEPSGTWPAYKPAYKNEAARPALKEYVSVFVIPRLVFRNGDLEEKLYAKFVMIKDTSRDFLKFPGGGIEREKDESPLEAAVRETKEEVNLDINGKAQLIGELRVSPGKYVVIFTADLDGSEAQSVEQGPEQDAAYIWHAWEIDARFASLGANHRAMWRFYKERFPEKL